MEWRLLSRRALFDVVVLRNIIIVAWNDWNIYTVSLQVPYNTNICIVYYIYFIYIVCYKIVKKKEEKR